MCTNVWYIVKYGQCVLIRLCKRSFLLKTFSHDNIMITLSEANLLAASTFSLRFAVSCENFCCSPTNRESCCSLALCSGCERWTSNSWWLRLSMLALAVSNSEWSCEVKTKKRKQFTVLIIVMNSNVFLLYYLPYTKNHFLFAKGIFCNFYFNSNYQ